MRTVILGDPPFEIEQAIEKRRQLGQDHLDEVWEGEYHVAPAPSWRHARAAFQLALILGPYADRAGLVGTAECNIGSRPDDYRVPDQAYFADRSCTVFNPTAEIVVEIVSPGDESRQKFGFYAARNVKEILLVDPEARSVEWFARSGPGFLPADGNALLDISSADLAGLIDWPQ